MPSAPNPDRVRLIWLTAGIAMGLLLGQVWTGPKPKTRDEAVGVPVEPSAATALPSRGSEPGSSIRALGQGPLPHPNAASAEAIIAWVRSLPNERTRNDLWENILSGIALSNPTLALETAAEISKNGGQGLVATVLGQVAQQHFETALRWFQSQPEGDRKREVAGALAAAWAANDFAGADAMRLSLPLGYDRLTFTEKIAGSFARQDPNAALAWANGLPDPEERTKALAAVAGPLGEQSPAAGMKLVMSLPEGADRNAFRKILRRWAATDWAGAAAWAATLSETESPDGYEIRNQALQDIARATGFKDREAGMDWLDKLPPGKSHDMAVVNFVSAADGYDIALATQAAMKIQNPELRDAFTANTLRRWLREDAAAARAWMDANSIPDAIRQTAQNPPVPTRGPKFNQGPRL